MDFSLQDFFNTNKRIFIWTAFFVLLYLIRRFFGLVFLTFILSFIFYNLIRWLDARTRFGRRVLTVLVYLVFVAMITTALSFITPRLITESKAFLSQVPETADKIHAYLDRLAQQQPNLAPVMERLKESLSLETLLGVDQAKLVGFLVESFNRVTALFSYFFIGILFSFLILFDYPRLLAGTRALRETRLRAVYEETADSVVEFALVVGAAFQAQILIACVNTFLTGLGLYGLDIHPIVLLCTIVFFAGLIPVLGVFLSSVPICLLAFNSGGLGLMLYALAMIVMVHLIEAYVLNPNIVSAVLKINPVLTLFILYIGHSLFGLWGVLLGAPVSVYIYRYALKGGPAAD